MGRLLDAFKAAGKELLKDEGVRKGDKFEKFVEEVLFPDEDYKLIHKTIKTDLNGRYVESREQPDFHFQHRNSSHKFWVEAKFRSQLINEKIEWASSYSQFRRYKKFQEQIRPEKVFIAIGFGGWPDDPDNVYIAPLDNIQYTGLYPSKLKPYEIRYAPVRYQNGRIF